MTIVITTEDTMMTIMDKALKAAFREIEFLKMNQDNRKDVKDDIV